MVGDWHTTWRTVLVLAVVVGLVTGALWLVPMEIELGGLLRIARLQ